jgi:hypothetical protein
MGIENRQLKLGIASCVVVLIVWGINLLGIPRLFWPAHCHIEECVIADYDSVILARDIVMYLSYVLSMAGTLLAIISLRATGEKKGFGILGIILNLLTPVVIWGANWNVN